MDRKTFDFLREISAVVDFYKSYWFLTAAYVLALSVVAVNIYFSEEGVPLGVMSSDVVAGLPAMFVMILFGVLALAFIVVVPIGVLLIGSKKFGKNILEDYVFERGHEREKYKGVQLSLVASWVCMNLIAALYVVSMLFLEILDIGAGYLPITVMFLVGYMLLQIIVIAQVAGDQWKDRSAAALGAMFVSAIAQLTNLLLIGIVLKRKIAADDVSWVAVYVLVAFFVTFSQVVMALVWVEGTRKRKVLIRASFIGGCLMALICICPPLNNLFVGYVLGVGSMGGKGCVVITWREGKSVINELVGDVGLTSIPLRAPASNTYQLYVRPVVDNDKKHIYFVQRSDVEKISSCGSE